MIRRSYMATIAHLDFEVSLRRHGRAIQVTLLMSANPEIGAIRSDTLAVILKDRDGNYIHHDKAPAGETIPQVSTSMLGGSAEAVFSFPVHPHTNLKRCIVVFRSDWAAFDLD